MDQKHSEGNRNVNQDEQRNRETSGQSGTQSTSKIEDSMEETE